MSSLVYHSGTRGINFHTLQWFGVPKAFTVLLFKPLLSHTITIPNSLAGNQPTGFTTLVFQSFTSPVRLCMSFTLVNDVNFFSAEIAHYATNCSWLLCSRQVLHASRSFFNKIRCESHFPKRLEAKKKTYCFLPNNELSLLFTGHKMQKFVHLFYWNTCWLLSSRFKLIFHFQ